MFQIRRFAPFLVAALLLAGEPIPQGLQVAARFDAMDVEHHWLAGSHVNWHSGDPDSGKPDKTHCSAFVAAACERLGVYILRPPDHKQVHLATAQAEWLQQEGMSHGWKPVDTPFHAQELANQGQLVVAVFPSPDSARPGHVALLRANPKPDALIEREGPQIIQAGGENTSSTSLKAGFRHHPGAWHSAEDNQIRFYVHGLP
jgi:hypothetical protein